MSWVRIHDGAIRHPKLVGLVDWKNPFCLWVWGLSYVQEHLTDGVIVKAAMPNLTAFKTAQKLITQALWREEADVFIVHDYLDWNDSKEVIKQKRTLGAHRVAFLRDPALRQSLRDRDKDMCRYCGRSVNWQDRKGGGGATYDHVDPRGTASLSNLVVACRSCNSSKRNRTPEEAGLTLLPIPAKYLDQDLDKSRTPTSGVVLRTDLTNTKISEGEFEGKPSTPRPQPVMLPPESDIAERAAALLETYGERYTKHRKGAKHLQLGANLDWTQACELCRTWDDERLGKLIDIFLTTDDEWVSSTARTFRIFVTRASWCDDRLAQWEAKRRHA